MENLKKISSLTDEERKEIWKIVFGREFPKNGKTFHFEAKDCIPSRIVLWSGIDRLGFQSDGRIWADSDLFPFDLSKTILNDWLVKNGFA